MLGRGVREVELLAAGCLHVGAIGCDENLIVAAADYVAASENRFLILMGDVVDAISHTDHRFDPKEVADWMAVRDLDDLYMVQAERVAALLKAVPRDRLLGLCDSNHQNTPRKLHQLNVTRQLCKLLNAKFLGDGAFLRWHFKGRDAGDAAITLFAEHGAGGAGSPEAVLTKLKKQAVKHPGADVYLIGQHHKHGFVPMPTAGLSHEFSLQYAEPLIVSTGCFLNYHIPGERTYGERFGMPVPGLGPAKLRIFPWGKPGAYQRNLARAQRVSYVYPWWA